AAAAEPSDTADGELASTTPSRARANARSSGSMAYGFIALGTLQMSTGKLTLLSADWRLSGATVGSSWVAPAGVAGAGVGAPCGARGPVMTDCAAARRVAPARAAHSAMSRARI